MWAIDQQSSYARENQRKREAYSRKWFVPLYVSLFQEALNTTSYVYIKIARFRLLPSHPVVVTNCSQVATKAIIKRAQTLTAFPSL
jgi:hypothetical protein